MAIRITRVEIRTGDKGDTALVGGRRVPKDASRIEAYGTIDEPNSIIGPRASSTPSASRRARRRAASTAFSAGTRTSRSIWAASW